MRSLFPPLEASASYSLTTETAHRVYYEECGNPDGIPAVFLHGGPGSGCKADHRQFFDPKRYRVVLVDQRGAGRSSPVADVSNNTTLDLINDLENIRQQLGIKQWVLLGGSWGAALALAYAEHCPDQVLGMILRGTFLARRRDVDWFFSHGANRLLPRQWQTFVDEIGYDGTDEILNLMYAGIFSDDEGRVERYARAWEAWSGAVVMYSINQAAEGAAGPASTAIAKARIEMHYARHGYFIEENELLDKIHLLPRVPLKIIHGARDITCPAESAWLLHQAVTGSELEVLRTAGHLSSESPMIDALVRATDDMAGKLNG